MKIRGFWRYENGLLAMMFFTFGIVFLDRLAILYLMPFIAPDFGLNNLQIGILTGALALTWAASGFLIGSLADRSRGHKAVLITMITIFSLCSIGSGLASTFAVLLLARAIMGLSEGPVLPIAQSLMAAESSQSRRGFNMGFLQTSGSGLIGAVIGPPLVIGLANAVGWRWAFYIVGVPGLVIAAVLAVFLRAPRMESARTETAKPVTKNRLTLSQIIRQRNIWLCTLIACACMTWIFSMIVFLPIYLVQTKHFTTEEMSLIMMMTGVGTMVWGFVVPAISDRLGRRPTTMVFFLMALLGPLATIYMGHSVPMLAFALFIAYSVMGCPSLVMATIPAESLSTQYVATALGLIMGIGEVVGGVMAPIAAGAAADFFGPDAPFWVAFGGAAVAFLLAFAIVETAPAKIGLGMKPQASTI
jgi:MFS family permease